MRDAATHEPSPSTPSTAGAARTAPRFRLRRRPRRLRERRTFRFTREGKVFLLVTLGVGFAAVNTGNNLLFLMLGLMLSLLLVSGILSEIVLRRVRVARRLPERAFAHAICLVEIVLANDKRRVPSYSLQVEDRADGEPTERRCYFLKVAPRAEQTASYRRTPSRRGVLSLRGFRLGTRYPFGLIEKCRLIPAPDTLIVYPALVPVDRADLAQVLDGLDAPTGRPGHGTELGSLREYRAGDEARTVHWRRTAALGHLVVRARERDAAGRLTLVIDNGRPDDAEPDDAWHLSFERALSRAAALAAAALAHGAAVDVLARTGASPLVLPGAAPDPIWRFLALLEPVAARDTPPLPSRPPNAHVVAADFDAVAAEPSTPVAHAEVTSAPSSTPSRPSKP